MTGSLFPTARGKREDGPAALSTGAARGMRQKLAGEKGLRPPPPE